MKSRYVFKKRSLLVLIGIFDLLGYFVVFFFKVFKRKNETQDIKKILIIRLDHIGDIIMSLGIMSSLRKKYPGAVIDFMVPGIVAGLIKNNTFVDNILEFDPTWFSRKHHGIKDHLKSFQMMIKTIKEGEYDVAIDLRGDLRHIAAMYFSGVKTRISYGITGGGFLLTYSMPYNRMIHEEDKNIFLLRALGIKSATSATTIAFDSIVREQVRTMKKDLGIEGMYAVIHPLPGHPSKKWDKEKFEILSRYIRDKKRLLPVFVGTNVDRDFIQGIIKSLEGGVIDLSGKTSISTMAKLIEDASLFVGVDSGPAHIAAALNVDTLVLFSGINNPGQWAPRGENVHLIYPGKGKGLSVVSAEKVCKKIDEIIDRVPGPGFRVS